MTLTDTDSGSGTDRQMIDKNVIGARLEVARLCKYPDLSIAQMARKLKESYGISRFTYYAHERGDYAPPLAMIKVYAAFFGVPVKYLRSGTGGDDREEKARQAAHRRSRILRLDRIKSGGNPETTLTDNVNQRLQKENLLSSQKASLRFIVKLMSEDVVKIARGKASISEIDREPIPAPPLASIGERACWYEIPKGDFSMKADGLAGLPPGTLCLVDFDAPIEPENVVLAVLADQEEPIVRLYRSDRSWRDGVQFTLEALNTHSRTITIEDAKACLLIGRVIFSGSPR